MASGDAPKVMKAHASNTASADPLGADSIYPRSVQSPLYPTVPKAYPQQASSCNPMPCPQTAFPASQCTPSAQEPVPTECTPSHPLITHPPTSSSSDPMASSFPQQLPAQAEDKEWSVLLIGKTGNGKSSLGNTILGPKQFKTGRGMSVTTRDTQAVSGTVRGRRLKVIDTADFTNLLMDDHNPASHVQRWKDVTSGSPDVIMLLVRCDVRYTKEEHAIYRQIVDLWGDRSLFQRRLMVAFTFGDLQDEDLGEELKTVNEELKSVLRDAQNRYVQVNNRERDEEEKKRQLKNICDVIDRVIKDDDKGDSSMEHLSCPDQAAVLLVGKTGQGKSSLGNILTWPTEPFAVGPGLMPITKTAEECWADHWASVCTRRLKVIDTPDLTTMDEKRKRQEVERWKRMTQGLPVIMVLVLRCDVRMTSDELAVYRDVKKLWGDRNYRVMIVFTFRDRLDYNLEEQLGKLPDHLKELREVLAEAENVYVMVNSVSQQPEDEKEAYGKLVLSLINERVTPRMATVRTMSSENLGDRILEWGKRKLECDNAGHYDRETDSVNLSLPTSAVIERRVYYKPSEETSIHDYCSIL